MATDDYPQPAVVPLTVGEIQEATAILDKHGVCVATLQRKMRIGWNRAADLVERIKGRNALPSVALKRRI